ncbi:hypothetical protein [Kutzneria buriramensis]|uniref:hypothetical protein n=1 Tax=Kutzneria buriramensis TaxID=1045776 RepID=UPI001477792A|nr:hypothetical protein [Kutzneria buriramensis]
MDVDALETVDRRLVVGADGGEKLLGNRLDSSQVPSRSTAAQRNRELAAWH